ncbi:hypothetical protein IVB43_23830 [Bradyrhizobium sp. 48]|uniref:portal protein n=1 Tax=Bradyrhizobium sp. 48 TaxID=2782676 RepID=UPI001FFA3386|nr:portal protein [Bradyrhizobium sp. 48]MCK1445419.1 hypothetical protein [Bradyrhizobium sp. 48]
MADESPTTALEREGLERLAAARVWKSLWDLDLREAYFFATPQRQRNVLSTSPPPQQRLLDAAELNTDLAFELCGDFATEVINTYMPEATAWCERGKGMFISQEQFDEIATDVKAQDKSIFAAMKASNLYPELSKAFDPDLAIGTVGMWIDPSRPGGPVSCMAVPIRELEINLGPDGEIDDRFVIRYTRNCYVQKLLGDDIWAKVDAESKKKIAEKPAERTEIKWAFWRLWSDHSDEAWQHTVYLGKKLVHDVVIKGEGCCPLIVFRWNPNPDWPWGHGPLMQYMPSLRQVDELELMRIEHAEMAIKPPIGYPDDSFTEIEQGLEPGMAYPMRRGSGQDVVKIYEPPPSNPADYQYEEKEKRLRRGFFVDFPEQTGDTPPTLGQWLDEMARAQRRIGRPGLPFWREGPAKIFLRFKYLLERSGSIKPITVDGKAVALMPYNPTQRAAEQQEIATTVQGLQLAAQLWPEEYKLIIDGKATMKALFDKMRVELIKYRDEKKVDGVLKQMAQLIGSTAPGAQRPAQLAASGQAPAA